MLYNVFERCYTMETKVNITGELLKRFTKIKEEKYSHIKPWNIFLMEMARQGLVKNERGE